jgi:hypothetical protein
MSRWHLVDRCINYVTHQAMCREHDLMVPFAKRAVAAAAADAASGFEVEECKCEDTCVA